MERRKKPLKTKNGIVIYKRGTKNCWAIDLPNGKKYRGSIDTPKLQSFIYHLGQGKSLECASKIAGFGRSVLKGIK